MTVPKLRFPEFRDAGAWDKLSLGDISDRITEKVGNSKLMTVSITAGTGFVSQAEKFSRDISGSQYKNYIRLKRGEFSYNKGNSKRFPQGCVYKLKEFDEVAVPNAFISFKIKEKYIADFYAGYFDNNAHGSQLTKYITSGARSDGLLNVSPDEFFSIILPTPLIEKEQEKIAECLASIDDRITTEIQKLDTLRAHKKGLMQQLFPATGETLPQLRFPEFHNAGQWEEYSVCKLVQEDVLFAPKDGNHGNLHPKSSDYVEVGIPFIMANDLKNGAIDFSKCTHITKELADSLQKGFAKEGDVLLTHKGTVGEVALIKEIKFPYLMLTPQVTYYRIKNREKLSNEFLAILFTSEFFQKDLKIAAGGGTRDYIGITEQGKLKIVFPVNLLEQQKIADCLASLNELITLQFKKIDVLKLHKKGLMQQLFPSVDEASG